MHCPDEQTLTSFADGELAPGEADDVGRHVARCPACAEFLQEQRQLDALGRMALTLIPVTPLSSTVGSEAWNSRDLKSRPH